MKTLLSVSVAALLLAGAGSAATITFTGALSGANENPPTGSPGTGSAVVTYDSTAQTLLVDVVFSGLETGTTASHIHCCVLPHGDASVATTTPSFVGFPLGVTSGTFVSTLDLRSASSFNPAFVSAEGGSVSSAAAALITGLEGGMAYLNIHTAQFPSGEVRALLEPVPEPAPALLVAGALGILLLLRLKRSKRLRRSQSV